MNIDKSKLIRRIQFLHKVGRVAYASDFAAFEVQGLNRLVADGELNVRDQKYYLTGFEELIDNNYAQRIDYLISRVKKYAFVFNCCPFIKEIAICNTLALGVPSEESDIDLLVVLDSKRFYLGRFVVSVFTHLSGARRHHKQVKDRFCLSFFVSDECLDFTNLRIEDDVYFYYWFYYLVFGYGNYKIQSQLLDSNTWFSEHDFVFKNENLFKKNFIGWLLEMIFGFFFFGWLEKLMKKQQLKRANKKHEALGQPKGVVIKDGILKFHVVDIREEFRKEFYRSFDK